MVPETQGKTKDMPASCQLPFTSLLQRQNSKTDEVTCLELCFLLSFCFFVADSLLQALTMGMLDQLGFQ